MNTSKNIEVKKVNNGFKEWTPEEDEFLAEAYVDPQFTVGEVAEALGRSVTAVWNRANKRGIVRGEARSPRGRKKGSKNKKRIVTKTTHQVEIVEKPQSVQIGNNDNVIIRLTKGIGNNVHAEIDFGGQFNDNNIVHVKAVEVLSKVGKQRMIYEL